MSLKLSPREASAEKLSRPLNSVRTCVRPRISTPVGSPEGWVLSSFDWRRLTVMPGTRCSASDTDLSGKAPMSVAVIESTKVSAFFLMLSAELSAPRTPTTTISLPGAASAAWPSAALPVEVCWACGGVLVTAPGWPVVALPASTGGASCACAAIVKPSAASTASDAPPRRPRLRLEILSPMNNPLIAPRPCGAFDYDAGARPLAAPNGDA